MRYVAGYYTAGFTRILIRYKHSVYFEELTEAHKIDHSKFIETALIMRMKFYAILRKRHALNN